MHRILRVLILPLTIAIIMTIVDLGVNYGVAQPEAKKYTTMNCYCYTCVPDNSSAFILNCNYSLPGINKIFNLTYNQQSCSDYLQWKPCYYKNTNITSETVVHIGNYPYPCLIFFVIFNVIGLLIVCLLLCACLGVCK